MGRSEDRIVLSLSHKFECRGTLQAGTRREVVGISVSVLCGNGRQNTVCRWSVGVTTGVVDEVSVNVSDHEVVRWTGRFTGAVEGRKQRCVVRSIFSADGAIRREPAILRQLPIIRR